MITMLILDTLSSLGRYCILITQNLPNTNTVNFLKTLHINY